MAVIMINNLTIVVILLTSIFSFNYHEVSAQEMPQSPTQSPTCPQDSTWLILFIVTLVAFMISIIAHIIVYVRARKNKQSVDGDYVITNIATKQAHITGSPPTDDYEKPMQSATLQPTVAGAAPASTKVSRAATMPMSSSSESDKYKEVTVIGPSVRDRKSMFEGGTTMTTHKEPDSSYEVNVDIDSNQVHLRHTSKSSDVSEGQRTESVYEVDNPNMRASGFHGDVASNDNASVLSLGMPDDDAPEPYEKLDYKKSRCRIM